MKKYMKNKNFIPERYYNKVEMNNSKRENAIIMLFILINLFLLPTTYKEMNKANEKQPVINQKIEQNIDYSDDINIWINNIFDNNIERVNITCDKGEIILGSLDEIDRLNLNGSLKIDDMKKVDDEKYKLGVSLNE